MIWPSKWRHLKGLADIMALASSRSNDPRHYPTSPLFATEPPVYGQQTLEKFAERVGVEYKALLEYKRASEAFQYSDRSEYFSWAHRIKISHRDDRLKWLKKAE